jgi:hypothetical protein
LIIPKKVVQVAPPIPTPAPLEDCTIAPQLDILLYGAVDKWPYTGFCSTDNGTLAGPFTIGAAFTPIDETTYSVTYHNENALVMPQAVFGSLSKNTGKYYFELKTESIVNSPDTPWNLTAFGGLVSCVDRATDLGVDTSFVNFKSMGVYGLSAEDFETQTPTVTNTPTGISVGSRLGVAIDIDTGAIDLYDALDGTLLLAVPTSSLAGRAVLPYSGYLENVFWSPGSFPAVEMTFGFYQRPDAFMMTPPDGYSPWQPISLPGG